MRILIPVLLALLGITPHVHAQPRECDDCCPCCDLYFVLTCSDTMVELDQLMGGAREGLRDLFTRIRTTGSGCRPRISLCCYGTTADEQITPDGPLNADLIQMIGGISRLDLGIECARASSQANGRAGVGQTMVLIVGEDPLGFGADDFTDASREQIRLARAEGFDRITLTTVSENVYGDLIQDFADDPIFWIDIQPDFREFERRSRLGPADDDLWAQHCCPSCCPVEWTPWVPWTTCSVSCGGGSRGRTRTCIDLPPGPGEQNCSGQGSQSDNCNNITCPGPDGNWAPWGPWTCSVTCGRGTRGRTRTCTNPAPGPGGRDCQGPGSDSDNCNLQPCTIIEADCDECIIINGIGYKDLDPCWKYLQCFFDEDGGVVHAIERTAAWGNFWNQFHINQDKPGLTDCRFDECRVGHVEGDRYPYPGNCRGYWECGPGSRTLFLACCDVEFRFNDATDLCEADSTCTDACPPILPTSQGPLPCPLRIREGTGDRIFYNILDPGAEDQECREGQVFDELLCTCVNLIHEGCVPDFWLDFRGGIIADLSIHKFFIENRNVAVVPDGAGEYYGVFNKDRFTQLVINGLASFDPGETFVVYTRYRRDLGQSFPTTARPAILSDSDCIPLDYSYAAYANPPSGGARVAGWVWSADGPSQERVNTNENNGINTYIMIYQGGMPGETLTLTVNANDATPAGPGPTGRVRENACALHIGYGAPEHNLDYFTGDIYEVRIYRCIPESFDE